MQIRACLSSSCYVRGVRRSGRLRRDSWDSSGEELVDEKEPKGHNEPGSAGQPELSPPNSRQGNPGKYFTIYFGAEGVAIFGEGM